MPRAHAAKNQLTQAGTDPDALRATFADRGVIRLDGALSIESAARMQTSMWRYAESRTGLRRADRATWPTGPLSISWKCSDRDHTLDALAGCPKVRAALDAMFGAGGWMPRRGAQILITMPSGGRWTLNDGWHMDGGFEQPTWPVLAVKLFSFLGEVGPRGGGTLLLVGSHRVVERYRADLESPPGSGKRNWLPFMRANPPLDDLLRGATMPELGRELVGKRLDVEGIPVDVVELTGSPGDVVITHLHVFHSASANTSGVPRLMLRNEVDASEPQTGGQVSRTHLRSQPRDAH